MKWRTSMELLDRIDRFARETPDHPAYVDASTGQALSYRQLNEDIARQADAVRGQAIVLHAANRLHVPSAFLGAIAAGADVLMMNDAASAQEVAALAARIQAFSILTATATPGASASVPMQRDEEHPSPDGRSRRRPDHPGCLLLATSGSTALPKIVRRKAESMDAVARNCVEAIGFAAGDRVLAAVPLTHSYGIEHGLLAPLWAGATVVLCGGLDLPTLARAFELGITIFPAVPSMIERLADVSDAVAGVEHVRRAYSAGGLLPATTRTRFTDRYGVPIGQLYGSTEVGTVVYRPEPGADGDVGWAMRDVSIRVLDAQDPARPAEADTVGEIAIRSPSMFSGYVHSDQDDGRMIDGHFLTGDLGRITADRTLQLSGRSRLLIDTGGLKVNPMEVEHVLAQHPAVAECVVVALRQTETVHRLRAVIVRRPHGPSHEPATADEIRSFARSKLAAYKVPRTIEFRDALPRSATGKVLRHIVEAS